MAEIAVEVPMFRSMSLDESRDVLVVQLTGILPDLEPLEAAIAARFPELSGKKIEVIDATQVYGHLTEWYTQIGALWSQPDLVGQMVYTGYKATGDDIEIGDVIEIGVLTEAARRAAYRGIAELGIPLDAVDVVITGPVTFD